MAHTRGLLKKSIFFGYTVRKLEHDKWKNHVRSFFVNVRTRLCFCTKKNYFLLALLVLNFESNEIWFLNFQ